MKKLLLVPIFILAFSFNLFAEDYELEEPKTGADIYLLVNPGVIIPERIAGITPYDASFTGGILAGFQINRGFAIDISVLFQSLTSTVSVLENFNAMDIRFYPMYQPVIQINKDVKILPNIGGGVIYSYSPNYGLTDMFGVGAKIGVRATYKMFIGGIGIDYAYKGGWTGGTSFTFEAGVIFD